MVINICSSPSSGSTFLANILDRHPAIVCGDELTFLAKPVLYTNYRHFKRWAFIIKYTGITSNPYFRRRTTFTHLENYRLSRKQVWEWVSEANNITELTQFFRNYVMELTGKEYWAEKTPLNVGTLSLFIKTFPESKIIHIIRDPRDVILSLMKRDRSLLRAAERWLVSVALVQPHLHNPNLLEIRYEDLILNKEETLFKICKHLNIDFRIEYFLRKDFESTSILKSDGHKSWSLDPGGNFSSKAIGKFKNSETDWNIISKIKLTPDFANLLGVDQISLLETANNYGYALNPSGDYKFHNKMFKWKVKEPLYYKVFKPLLETDSYMDKVLY